MQRLEPERPTVAFTLSLLGLVVQVAVALVVGAAASGMFGSFGATRNMIGGIMGGMMGIYQSGMSGMMRSYTPLMMSGWGMFTWMWVPIIAVTLGIAAIGVFMMNSSDTNAVRTGSVLVLVPAVVAFPTMWGFIIGSTLMLIGSILGLTWIPHHTSDGRTL